MTPSQRARARKAKPKKEPGGHYASQAYNRAIKKACDRAKVPVWHPHRLRHSVGTAIRSEFGQDTAAAVLGHTDITTTAIYAQLDEAKAVAAMEKVG